MVQASALKYKVGGGGGQCIKEGRGALVCQFTNKMADGGSEERGQILTNNKNNNKTFTKTREPKSKHFIIYTQFIFPSCLRLRRP